MKILKRAMKMVNNPHKVGSGNNGLRCPLFVLDYKFILDFINGRMLRNRLFEEIMRRKNENIPFVCISSLASLQRAIYLANRNASWENMKFLMELVKIYPSKANYKNDKEVTDELTKLAKILSEGAL